MSSAALIVILAVIGQAPEPVLTPRPDALPQPVVVEPAAAPKIRPWHVLTFTSGVIAIAGTSFGLVANAEYQLYRLDPFNDALGNRARIKANVADALFITAAVAAGVGFVLWLVGR